MVMHPRAYVLNGLGTGKTLSTLLALDYLIQIGLVTQALVVAPKAVLQLVWEKEIYDRMPRLKPVVLSGTRKQRLKGLHSFGWNVAIINVEGVKVIANELHAVGFEAMVLDELALYRDQRTERWRIMSKLVQTLDYCWGLTGSPTPNGPWDAYAQAKLLTPWQVPMSFGSFQQKVAVQGAFPGQWLPRKGADKIVCMRSCSRRSATPAPRCWSCRRSRPSPTRSAVQAAGDRCQDADQGAADHVSDHRRRESRQRRRPLG